MLHVERLMLIGNCKCFLLVMVDCKCFLVRHWTAYPGFRQAVRPRRPGVADFAFDPLQTSDYHYEGIYAAPRSASAGGSLSPDGGRGVAPEARPSSLRQVLNSWENPHYDSPSGNVRGIPLMICFQELHWGSPFIICLQGSP